MRYKGNGLSLCILCLLTLGLATTSCKRSNGPVGGNSNSANSNQAAGATLKTPPFSTREPDRYQAIRVFTGGGGPGSPDSINGSVLIARDGDRRREEFEFGGAKASYLILPSGNYLLWPDKKIYAELTSGRGGSGNENAIPPDFSPDKLLNQERPESIYEELGLENIDGRQTRKYRVVIKGKLGAAKETAHENLVWVDEKLGMPIRTEINSRDGARVVIALREIRETIDEGLFDLPQDYLKVSENELFARLRGTVGTSNGGK